MINDPGSKGLPASELEFVFRRANVLRDWLDTAQSARARSTRIGTFLSPHVDRAVDIEHDGRRGTATLRCVAGRAKSKTYCFEVRWDDQEGGATEAVTATPSLVPPLDFQTPASTANAPGPATDNEGGNDEQWQAQPLN
jgi:hypothetical protein